jgi:hypothetical protein
MKQKEEDDMEKEEEEEEQERKEHKKDAINATPPPHMVDLYTWYRLTAHSAAPPDAQCVPIHVC